jgi:hypothetical protein
MVRRARRFEPASSARIRQEGLFTIESYQCGGTSLQRAVIDEFRLESWEYDERRLTMGRRSCGNPRVATFPGDTATVKIGSFTSMGRDVHLMDHRELSVPREVPRSW